MRGGWRRPGLGLLLLVCLAPWAKADDNLARDVRRILSDNCVFCHGPDPAQRQGGGEGGLRLDTRDGALADLGGHAAIVPGQPDASELLRRIAEIDPELVMPPPKTGKRVSPADLEKIRQWIADGATYVGNWSYTPIVRPATPPVKQQDWSRNPIDRFILAKLEHDKKQPSVEADRGVLARRVSLDLTGLPPTPEIVDRLVARKTPDAYDRFVERILASPAYGEHWGRQWLDLARYADSSGYADDPARTIWLYRDYVIRAWNENLPFDRFTVEQLAGDLLPDRQDRFLVATAFHRNTMTNNEGGTNDEEFRNVAIVDRVNTTLAVWMGTTAACAQCHTHKYDPLTQTEYFQLFAFFNNTADADRRDEAPLFEDWDQRRLAERDALQQQMASLQPHKGDEDQVLSAWVPVLAQRIKGYQPKTTVPIFQELPEKQRRMTRLQRRGNFMDLGEEVPAGVPAVFPPLPKDVAANRLGLSQWLMDRSNPLTARVLANRLWETVFGVGLVRTSEEFGSQGEPPSHPELLDWLAAELHDTGWDVKHLLRLMVTSATYRQSSKVTPELLLYDPDNRYYARGPRTRLSAEAIRDQALFVSGLLSDRMYGEPVRPQQPSQGLSAAFGSGTDWNTSHGEDKFRRGIYTTWRRSNPYASMSMFDAPNREVCTIRRATTNTPLQALVTMNDPVFLEAAQALARRMIAAVDDSAGRIREGVRRVLCREPTLAETERLQELLLEATQQFASDPEAATKLATQPLGDLPKDADVAEYAAWTLIGNVLLNLDEFLMRP